MKHNMFRLEAWRKGIKIHDYTDFNNQTDNGLQFMYDRFFNETNLIPYELGVGTGTGDPSRADTDLTNGVWKQFNSSNVITRGDMRVIYVDFGTSEANMDIREIGIRTNGDNPILIARNLTKPFDKSSVDTGRASYIIDMSEVIVPQ